MKLDVEIQTDDPGLIPVYQNPGDAGCDLRALENYTIEPNEIVLVDTGIKIAIPEGWVGLIHPRSGLAVKRGLTVINTPGTIDSGYRGPIKVALINLGPGVAFIERHSRIAQLVFQEVVQANFVKTHELSDTVRGEGGFGSTGEQ